MYNLIYSKHKVLRKDNSPTYFSFVTVLKYTEVQILLIFSLFYTASMTIFMSLTYPLEKSIDLSPY